MKILKWIKEQTYYKHVDWELLLFLILFLNVKLWVKVFSVLLSCFLNRKILFPIKLQQNKLLFFYLFIILIGIVNILFQVRGITLNYLVASTVGILFWLLAAFASYQCACFIADEDPEIIHSTVTLYFLLNVLVTFAMLFKIMIEIGSINPFTYQGLYQKYFVSTGDYLHGFSFDTSTTNAILNTLGVFYFISRKKALFTFLCMAVLLLTFSNLTNLLLVGGLIYIFIFQSDRDQKSLVGICLTSFVLFMVKISPQNNMVVQETVKRVLRKDSITPPPLSHDDIMAKPDNLLSAEEKKRKFARLYVDSIASLVQEKKLVLTKKQDMPVEVSGKINEPLKVKPDVPKDDIHSIPFQRKKVATPQQKELLAYVKKDKAEDSIILSKKYDKHVPGKILSFLQTLHFLQLHPGRILTGNGIGNFSSKLAFRTTALNIAGGYPSRLIYINKDFRENHLAIFLYYFTKDAQFHSIINTSNSVYDQLLSEYGILGLLVFFIFYVGYFARNRKLLTFGIPILLVMLGTFAVEYWFEQLSVIILFELLMMLDIRENKIRIHGS